MSLRRTCAQALAVVLLVGLVSACSHSSEKVEAHPVVTLTYLNPHLPDPVLPLATTLKSLVEWQHLIAQGKMVPENLVCMTQADSLEEAAWKKTVARWNSEMVRIVRFHEKMNTDNRLTPAMTPIPSQAPPSSPEKAVEDKPPS